MHVDQSPGTGPFMQIVNILGDDRQFPRPGSVKMSKRPMGGIGLSRLNVFPAHVVKTQNQIWISRKRFRSGHILHPVLFP